MQRILDPGQIEAFAQRTIPRLRLPDRTRVFSTRAARLRQQSEHGAIGHAIADYLRLMAHAADAQQSALANIDSMLPTDEQTSAAREFGMPVVTATGWHREAHWRKVLLSICDSLTAQPDLCAPVRAVCDRLRDLAPAQLDVQANALLAAEAEAVDAAAAPFIMSALQVYWVDLSSRMRVADIPEIGVPGVCPTCGTLPVASIVRTDPGSQGFRYLHCGLCATEWHMVRVKCSHCQSTKGISYQSIASSTQAIRAECCDSCYTYRKILYQEVDGGVEAVADDLASISLDLLLSEAGYARASPHPLLWS